MKKQNHTLALTVTLAACILLCLSSCSKNRENPEDTSALTETGIAGDALNSGETQPNHVCEAGEWIIDRAATCSAEGQRHSSCIVCGKAVHTEVLPKLPHVPVPDSARPATCTLPGLTEGAHCGVCHTVLTSQQTVDIVAHKESAWIIGRQPTCDAIGMRYTECRVCHLLMNREDTAAIGHRWGEWMTDVPATCVQLGQQHRVCTACDAVESGSIEPTGHTSTFISGTAPTCTQVGYGPETRCSVCDTLLTAAEEIPAIGHTAITDKAVAPTCSSTGLCEGTHCEVCGVVLTPQAIVHVTDHRFAGGSCSDCGTPAPTPGIAYMLAEDGQSYTVAGLGSVSGGDIVLASRYNGRPVLAIGAYAFCPREGEETSLTGVYIPAGIEIIEEGAFAGCTGLRSVTFPTGLKSIGQEAFRECRSLVVAECGDGLTTIGERAFAACTGLVRVCLPASLDIIGNHAFDGCRKLAEVQNDAGITAGDSDVLRYARHIYQGNTGETAISITEDGFIFFKDGGHVLLMGYTGAADTLRLPDTYQNQPYELYDCAFAYVPNLHAVTLGADVRVVPDGLFAGCTQLTSVTVPGTVTVLGDCLSNCPAMERFHFLGNTAQWDAVQKSPIWQAGADVLGFTVYVLADK